MTELPSLGHFIIAMENGQARTPLKECSFWQAKTNVRPFEYCGEAKVKFKCSLALFLWVSRNGRGLSVEKRWLADKSTGPVRKARRLLIPL